MTNDNRSRAEIQAAIFAELLRLNEGQFLIYSKAEAEAALGAGTIMRGIDQPVYIAPDEHGPPIALRTFPLADEGGRVVVLRPRQEELA